MPWYVWALITWLVTPFLLIALWTLLATLVRSRHNR
jgi:hypothetical protein